MVTIEGEHDDKRSEMLLDSELRTLCMLLTELGMMDAMKLELLILQTTETLELLEQLDIELLELLEHGRTE